MTSSFQTPEPGPEWSTPRAPEAWPEDIADGPAGMAVQGIMKVKALPPRVPYGEQEWPLPARLWVISRAPLPPDPVIHACALTYASDMGSGFGDGTAAGLPRGGPSIDHAVWFHEPIRMDDWVLLESWPLKAGGARGLYMGTMQDRGGRVGAMLTQDSLLRSADPRVTRPRPK